MPKEDYLGVHNGSLHRTVYLTLFNDNPHCTKSVSLPLAA